VLHLLAIEFSESEQAAYLLSLAIERGRESCGTTLKMNLPNVYRRTLLHLFARFCSDLSLTKMVLREYPPSLIALTNDGETPLHFAEQSHGSESEIAVFFSAATAAYDAPDFVTAEVFCGGSSPYLSRELDRQAIALRSAVTICLNRLNETAPSALTSRKSTVALTIIGRIRASDGAGHLLRRILDYVGPHAEPFDPDWMAKELMEGRTRNAWRRGGVAEELAVANKELASANKELVAANKELATANKEQTAIIREQSATISKLVE